LELAEHPFFIATLLRPELSSAPGDIHPLITAFTAAVLRHASG
jgi:CTP synthase (UTP-ammonia lyase)